MFNKGRKEGTFRFVFLPDWPAEKVSLAGDFNKWEPVTMRKQKNGSFAPQRPSEPSTITVTVARTGIATATMKMSP